ncbi:MAG: hypothetical protein ACRED4_07885, partial [Brevundimonas sp.]
MPISRGPSTQRPCSDSPSHLSGPLPWPEIDADKALPWIESRTGLSLAPSQAEALRLALRSKV